MNYAHNKSMRELSIEQKNELEELYQSFLRDEKVIRMKDIQMHRGSSCYIHSFRVAKLCIKKASRKKKYSMDDLKNVLTAAILHDYYLYDWRKHRELRKKHGTRHPLVACANAVRDFNISKEIQDIIKSHMWPLTPRLYPKTKEAKLVNRMDNHIATREALTFRAFKRKRYEKYMAMISRLFDE